MKRDVKMLAVKIINVLPHIEKTKCKFRQDSGVLCTVDVADVLHVHSARGLLRIAAAICYLERLGLVKTTCTCMDKIIGFVRRDAQ